MHAKFLQNHETWQNGTIQMTSNSLNSSRSFDEFESRIRRILQQKIPDKRQMAAAIILSERGELDPRPYNGLKGDIPTEEFHLVFNLVLGRNNLYLEKYLHTQILPLVDRWKERPWEFEAYINSPGIRDYVRRYLLYWKRLSPSQIRRLARPRGYLDHGTGQKDHEKGRSDAYMGEKFDPTVARNVNMLSVREDIPEDHIWEVLALQVTGKLNLRSPEDIVEQAKMRYQISKFSRMLKQQLGLISDEEDSQSEN